MKNTAQYKFTARKIIEKLTERLKADPEATYADWIITLMREGFKKDDAIKAFRKSNFVLLHDGTIIDKKELHKLKVSRKVQAEKAPSSSDSASIAKFADHYEAVNNLLKREAEVNRRLSKNLYEIERDIRSVTGDFCPRCAMEFKR